MIESLKWLGLAAMLAEHWMRFVVGMVPPWVYNCGRLAFPLFVFALALGLRSQGCPKLRTVLLRMFAWALVAQATIQLVDAPAYRLNVLFTLGLGVLVAYGLGCLGASLRAALLLCAVTLAAPWCEFGIVGVAFVAATVAVARAEDPPRAVWLVVAALLAALAVPNGNFYALVAVPVALVVWRLGLRVPRIRHAFYVVYAGQFVVFAGAQWLLA